MKKNYKISLKYAFAALVSVVFAQGTWAQTDLPETAGATLTAGKTYKVSKNVNINLDQDAVDSDGKPVNGLNIATGNAVTIVVNSGCTLTVKGSHSNGQNGAGAGISVPQNAELIIKGEGKLVAIGGNAGNGGDGVDGQIGGQGKNYNTKELDNGIYEISGLFVYLTDTKSGAGGNGGYGGGGAGAGIGGAGGAGGNGGTGNTTAPTIKSITPRDDGQPGGKGGDGSAGYSMGKVSILENVTVIATSGNSGTAGKGGISGVSLVDNTLLGTSSAVSGGGGGGAGGGAGKSTEGIGAGGCGAGGGGGGGCGAIDYTTFWRNGSGHADVNYSCRGGYGAGGEGAEKGGENNSLGRDEGVGNGTDVPSVGGAGGAGGDAGVLPEGANGSLYVASTAKLSEDATTTTIGATVGATYSIVTNEGASLLYGVKTINESLTAVNSDANVTSATITLSDNSNVGSETLNNPGKPVTLDLNGKGLLVNGAAGDITGNANVTILLKDDGDLDYTNRSYVSNTPVKYQRNFAASTRSGKWQALYLPFDVDNLPEGYDFGIVSDITADGLVIDKDVNSLEAFVHHSVRSANGMVNIEVSSETLKGTSEPQEVSKGSEGYALKGSLTKEHNKASEDEAFWILTNGGKFTWAKSGSHQRPYHWVVYAPAGSEAKSFALYTLGEDIIGDATVIDAVVMTNDNEPIYTISGVKVANSKALAPGMYIKGGKKFTVSK